MDIQGKGFKPDSNHKNISVLMLTLFKVSFKDMFLKKVLLLIIEV